MPIGNAAGFGSGGAGGELIATVVLMLLFLGEKTESVGIFGGILCLLQIVPLLVSIFVVEKKLQAAFDENGVRRR